MAKKKAPDVEDAERETAPLGADPADPDLDREDRRRLRHQRRFYTRERSLHRKWLDLAEDKDPEAFEDLVYWRQQSPQEFRKRLVRWALEHGVYEDRTYTSRSLPPLVVRRESG